MDFRKPECLNEPGSFIGLGKLFYGGSGECAYPGGIFDPLNFGRYTTNQKTHLDVVLAVAIRSIV